MQYSATIDRPAIVSRNAYIGMGEMQISRIALLAVTIFLFSGLLGCVTLDVTRPSEQVVSISNMSSTSFEPGLYWAGAGKWRGSARSRVAPRPFTLKIFKEDESYRAEYALENGPAWSSFQPVVKMKVEVQREYDGSISIRLGSTLYFNLTRLEARAESG
jgi:hypothetical protein